VSAVVAFADERIWIIAELSRLTKSMSWQDVTFIVQSVAWIEEVTGYELEILDQEVQNHDVTQDNIDDDIYL
jgi:hypothetical protein